MKAQFKPTYVCNIHGGKHARPVAQQPFNSVFFAMIPVMDKLIAMVKPRTCLNLIGGK